MKKKYETLLVLDVREGQEKMDAIVEKFKSLISENGEITKVDIWGKRRLAYPINDTSDGYYVIINFTAESQFSQEFARIQRITPGVLRSIIMNDVLKPPPPRKPRKIPEKSVEQGQNSREPGRSEHRRTSENRPSRYGSSSDRPRRPRVETTTNSVADAPNSESTSSNENSNV